MTQHMNLIVKDGPHSIELHRLFNLIIANSSVCEFKCSLKYQIGIHTWERQ